MVVDLKKYRFNKYSENYNQLFRKELVKLKKIFPLARIEHVGSSSVSGLGGKGIIDIAISVPKKEILSSIKRLQTNYYDFKPSGGDKDRKFLQKIIRYGGKERRVHLQLTHNDSFTWKSLISVRDYLRTHKEVAREYVKIKKEAIKHAKGEGKKYRGYKNSFLQKIEKIALKEYFLGKK